METKLLVSSLSLDGLKKQIKEYFYNSNITLVEKENYYEVHTGKGKISFIVREMKHRFRFERIED